MIDAVWHVFVVIGDLLIGTSTIAFAPNDRVVATTVLVGC